MIYYLHCDFYTFMFFHLQLPIIIGCIPNDGNHGGITAVCIIVLYRKCGLEQATPALLPSCYINDHRRYMISLLTKFERQQATWNPSCLNFVLHFQTEAHSTDNRNLAVKWSQRCRQNSWWSFLSLCTYPCITAIWPLKNRYSLSEEEEKS